MNDILIQIVAYWGFFFAGLFLLIFLTRGFLLKWLLVLISRGKKILVQVQDPIQDYFITGKIVGGSLFLKDRESKRDSSKSEKQIDFDRSCVYRAYGINCVLFNDEKNILLKSDLTATRGFDALKINNLLIRALSRPDSTADDRKKVITMFAAIAAAVLGLIIYYKLIGIEEMLRTFTSNPSAGVIPSAFAIFQNRK